MHSLCGIIGSCRTLLTLTLYLPSEGSAWTQSLCSSLSELRLLHTLTKDVVASKEGRRGAGRHDGMDVGWRPNKSFAMWSVSQVSRGPSLLSQGLNADPLLGDSSSSNLWQRSSRCTPFACAASHPTLPPHHLRASTTASSPRSSSSRSSKLFTQHRLCASGALTTNSIAQHHQQIGRAHV